MKTAFIITIFLFSALTVADIAITNDALARPGFREGNPFAAGYIQKPALLLPVFVIGQGAASFSLAELWKSNRTVAWILILGLTAFKGYVIIHNLKVLR